MSNKRIIQCFFTTLQERGLDCPTFEKKKGYCDKALWVFLFHQEIFTGIYILFRPLSPSRYWKTFHCAEGRRLRLDDASLRTLGSAISDYFQRKEGRGHLCIVEHHIYLGNHCIHAYPSDYTRERILYNRKDLARKTELPAFEVVFVFPPEGNRVEIWVQEPLKTIRAMGKIWATYILGSEHAFNTYKPSFNLEYFHTAEHGLNIPPESPITRVTVHKLRFRPTDSLPSTIHTVEADTSDNIHAVYEQMAAKNLEIEHLKQVGLEVYMYKGGGEKEEKHSFDISPQSVALDHDGDGAIIRQFLKDSGIEVKE